MSDDLVKRAREQAGPKPRTYMRWVLAECADALEAKDARIADLEARVAAAEANVDAFLDERDDALRRAEEAEARLRKYGSHTVDCDWEQQCTECTCGWGAIDTAIAAQEKP